MNQVEILNKIHNVYYRKYFELSREQAGKLPKGIEQTNETGEAKETEGFEEVKKVELKPKYILTILGLLEKIESGNLEDCSSIIKEVTIATDDIVYLVQIAIAYDHIEIFKLLSEKRTKVSLNDDLSNATKHLSEKISYFLLDKYVNEMDVEYTDEEGNTALHHALEWFAWNESKYRGFVKSVLSKGAGLDVENGKGETPFDLLLKYVQEYPITKGVERLNYVSVVLNYCKIDELKKLEGTPALNGLVKLAAECRCEGIFNLLVKNNIQISNFSDKDGNTALHYALKELSYDHYEYESFARFLLSKGARLDVENRKGETPFDLLIKYVREYFYDMLSSKRNANGTYDFICCDSRSPLQRLDLIVRLLGKHKIIPEGRNGTPTLNRLVDTIVECNHKEALDLLVENNIKISSTILEGIVKHNWKKKIFDCFLHKNKIDYQDESGDTALHHALRNLHYDKSMLCKVESLVSAGARFDIENNQGETPFDLLVEYIEKGFYGQASRLSYAWKLFNKCENKDVLKELKYKDGTPALDKLKELHTKCRNISIIVASTLAVVGVVLGAAIAAHSGMLVVGIGIGVCCLVVAAITYHCNSPANLLKDSNAEVVVDQTLAVK